jgi:hypothetical protein
VSEHERNWRITSITCIRFDDRSLPRPEYPRPGRSVPLNGTWDLDLPDGTGSVSTVPVVVPFAWEIAASGVVRTWL